MFSRTHDPTYFSTQGDFLRSYANTAATHASSGNRNRHPSHRNIGAANRNKRTNRDCIANGNAHRNAATDLNINSNSDPNGHSDSYDNTNTYGNSLPHRDPSAYIHGHKSDYPNNQEHLNQNTYPATH